MDDPSDIGDAESDIGEMAFEGRLKVVKFHWIQNHDSQL
jgi:hypothetical protein